MGKVAGELANRIILTNDNPRDENPEDIINDIISGTQKEVQVILDRKLAIQAAISGINADDEVHTRTNRVRKITTNECVLIAGKGAENYQIIDGEQLPFNDVEVVQGLL
jgi:UDP-N-acetylmuramoyl-L-alanyl-D-glutamate--2,6-diaminopimelate ligase